MARLLLWLSSATQRAEIVISPRPTDFGKPSRVAGFRCAIHRREPGFGGPDQGCHFLFLSRWLPSCYDWPDGRRYAHARQFKRANRALRKLKTYAGRVIRDIVPKIEDQPWLGPKLARLLALARRVLTQERGQRGPKVYSLHAPEVECIGKGKPHKPYEFGVKVSVATTLKRCKGGQFVIHAKALPGKMGIRSPRSSRGSNSSSAIKSSACTPTPATAATTRRLITGSGSTPPSKSAA